LSICRAFVKKQFAAKDTKDAKVKKVFLCDFCVLRGKKMEKIND